MSQRLDNPGPSDDNALSHFAAQARDTHHASVLASVVSQTLRAVPARTITPQSLQRGHGLTELHVAIGRLIDGFESVLETLIEVFVQADAEANYYGSASRLSVVRLDRANRHLVRIASDMRDLATALDGMLTDSSPVRARLSSVLSLCVSIRICEDFCIVRLGTPAQIPTKPDLFNSFDTALPVDDNTAAPLFLSDVGEAALRDWRGALEELETYRAELKAAVVDVEQSSEAAGLADKRPDMRVAGAAFIYMATIAALAITAPLWLTVFVATSAIAFGAVHRMPTRRYAAVATLLVLAVTVGTYVTFPY
jgi:hypothetical protein